MKRQLVIAATAALAVSACSAGGNGESESLELLVYESFPTDADNPVVVALDEFTADTGIDVEIIVSGDTGTMLSSAALTAGNPEADVIWGIDNTFLSRAIASDIFEPFEAAGLSAVAPEFTALVPNHEATPVDFGDVCLNYDIGALARDNIAPPTALADLVEPEYAGKLVVENPATSSPGMAFLLATIAEFGDDGWEQYWQGLRANDVKVASGWTEAYYGDFSWAGGDRPIVVSYGSSPPFEMLFATEPLDEVPTGVVESTCFRQVEFAGILRGTESPTNAGKLIDFLVGERFQREIALNLFVFPVNPDVQLDDAFVRYATVPADPFTVDPAVIDANRTDWIERWNATVLR
jgi:thiamine transport system substrate-binding protein